MRLVIIGFGYSSRAVHDALLGTIGQGIDGQAKVTVRTQEKVDLLKAHGIDALLFDGTQPSSLLTSALATATHILMSAAPDEDGDPFLRHHALSEAPWLQWAGYLSTIGVYGDHDGDWVDETTKAKPRSERSRHRVVAEQAWQTACAEHGTRAAIMRLSGIYGPGRSPIDRVKAGTARSIIKPGQVFNRIHQADIARVVAGAAKYKVAGILNVTDDEPAPPQDVIRYAARLAGVEAPDGVPFDKADMTPMARSFYSENKRASNAKIKAAFGPMLFPTYREGLASLV
ncbi:MAG: SDR family oxidoreductase [Pseudomonadota bacterium]